jgi:hypothetical protein
MILSPESSDALRAVHAIRKLGERATSQAVGDRIGIPADKVALALRPMMLIGRVYFARDEWKTTD